MNNKIVVLFFIVIAAGFTACKKNNDAPTVGSATLVNIINTYTDTVNFYLNGTRLNGNSNLYPYYSSGYISIPTGNQNFQIKKAFNTATSSVQQLFNLPLKLDTGTYYSLFIAGETQKQAFVTTDPLHRDTTSGKCLVRFVNASQDTVTKYDIVIGNAPKITGQGFGTASNFAYADTSSTAIITLYQAGSANPLSTDTVSLLQQKWYTFYTIGKLGGTGSSKLGLVYMINFN